MVLRDWEGHLQDATDAAWAAEKAANRMAQLILGEKVGPGPDPEAWKIAIRELRRQAKENASGVK